MTSSYVIMSLAHKSYLCVTFFFLGRNFVYGVH